MEHDDGMFTYLRLQEFFLIIFWREVRPYIVEVRGAKDVFQLFENILEASHLLSPSPKILKAKEETVPKKILIFSRQHYRLVNEAGCRFHPKNPIEEIELKKGD
ncbi:MAG: hypothetical protein KIH01_00085 [Candidatus Freyarchaeota archaeon]|nr:hypothetical protein [Candidatus Jordarchaeia archaeon]